MKRAKRPAPRPRKAKAPPSPVSSIALVLIDDNRLLREGLITLLLDQPGFKVLAASADADEALDKARLAKPDVVLIDFGLEDHDSLSLTAAVHQEVPGAQVVLMGVESSHRDMAAYLRAGAAGFVMKDASVEELFETIRCVAAGCQVLPPPVISLLAEQISSSEVTLPPPPPLEVRRLTSREQQVVALLGEGLCNKAIAVRLDIAVHTVKSHVHNVLEKLALHSRLEVAAFSHSHTPPGH